MILGDIWIYFIRLRHICGVYVSRAFVLIDFRLLPFCVEKYANISLSKMSKALLSNWIAVKIRIDR